MGNYSKFGEGQERMCLDPGAPDSLDTKEGHAFRAIFFPKMIFFLILFLQKHQAHLSIEDSHLDLVFEWQPLKGFRAVCNIPISI